MNADTKKDLKNISILALISLAIGIYLIVTTVVISKDGVTYIERSQTVLSDFDQLIKKNPPIGFDMLIVGFHSINSSLFKTSGVQSWILSAQICVLTCKILAMISLYFFGRCFFRRRHVFTSLLTLSLLPYPTQFGADVLRDWPHALFLFTSLLFLIKGIRQSSWIYMALAGLICGLGHIIRQECAQVVLFGLAIILWQLCRWFFKKAPFPRIHIFLFLLGGFFLVFIPYSQQRESMFSGKLKSLFSATQYCQPEEVDNAASIGHEAALKGPVTLLETICENFLYYFIVPVAIGLYLGFFRKKNGFDERKLLIGLFIGFNSVILVLLHSAWGYISRRHAMPLCILLSFYIPLGMDAIAILLTTKKKDRKRNLKKWSTVLVLIGIIICLPKSLRPLGKDKAVYLQAAQWIDEQTPTESRFLTFDVRIPFYANRRYWEPYEKKIQLSNEPDYLICVIKKDVLDVELPANYVLVETFQPPQRNKGIQIFKKVE